MDCFSEGTCLSWANGCAILSTALVFILAHVQASYTTPVGFLVVLGRAVAAWS